MIFVTQKGTRQTFKNGDEWDLKCRQILRAPKNGGWKSVKKALSKQRRKEAKTELQTPED